MSTATENQAPYIPDESEVAPTHSGGRTWRFSRGKIVTGPKDEITERDPQSIVGYVRRVGIYEGVTNDDYKMPIRKVEADIETRDGLIFVGGSLLNEDFELKVGRSVLDFAWGLLQITGEDLIRITSAQGEAWVNDKGQSREPSTYVNFARLEKDSKGQYVPKPIYKPKVDKNAPTVPMNDQWLALEPQIRAHALFADRPVSRDDDEHGNATTHLSAFCKECAEKGWSTPETLPGPWLALLTDFYKRPKAASSLADFTDDEWGQIRLKLKDNKDAPKAIKAAEAVKPPAAPAEDDPFASE